jgi:uncharacterized protein YpuA (DUF1002 family)
MAGGESDTSGGDKRNAELLDLIIERTKGNPKQREEEIKDLQNRIRNRGREAIKVAA